VPEASQVDILDRALALTRRNERIVLSGPLQQADPAQQLVHLRTLTARCGLDGTADDAGVIKPKFWLHATVGGCYQLTNAEFEASQLDDITLLQPMAAGYKISHYKPQLLGVAGRLDLVNPEGPISLHEAQERISSCRRRISLSDHLHLCAIAHAHRGLRHGKRLRMQLMRLKVEEVVRVSGPCL